MITQQTPKVIREVKYLPHKHDYPILDPQHPCYWGGVWGTGVVTPVIPALGRKREENPRALVGRQSSRLWSLRLNENLISRERWRATEEGTLGLLLTCICTRTHKLTPTGTATVKYYRHEHGALEPRRGSI